MVYNFLVWNEADFMVVSMIFSLDLNFGLIFLFFGALAALEGAMPNLQVKKYAGEKVRCQICSKKIQGEKMSSQLCQ